MNIVNNLLVGSASVAMLVGAAAPAAAQTPYGYGQYGTSNSGGGVVGAIINSVLGGGRYGTYGQGNDRQAVDLCARTAEAQVSRDRRYSGYDQYGQGQYGQNQYSGQYGQSQYGQSQYQGQYGQGGYPTNDPRFNQGYGSRSNARVVAVTSVERRTDGLKVRGLIDTGRNWSSRSDQNDRDQDEYEGQYSNQGQYQGQGQYPVPGQYPTQGYNDPRYPQSGYQQGVDPRFGGWNSQGYANAGRYAELQFSCKVNYRGQITRLNIERNNGFRRDY